jgi:hypothetical protein
MAELIIRHQQILSILRDHPAGLTNREILDEAKKVRGNEIPDDITQMGLNSQALRRRELLDTIDTPAGKIQRITEKGEQLLAESLGEVQAQPIPEKPQGPENITIEPSPLTQAMREVFKEAPAKVEQPKIPDIDPLAEFDKAVAIMREAMLTVLIEQTYPEPWPKVVDMPAKIELLEKLECMTLLNPDARDLIRGIRLDIEQMDAE